MNMLDAARAFRCAEDDVRLRNIAIRTALIKHGFLPSKFETHDFNKAIAWYYDPDRTVHERNAFWNNSRTQMLSDWDKTRTNDFEDDEYNVDGDGETKEEKAKREAAAAEYAKREQEINMEVTRRTKKKVIEAMDRMASFCRAVSDNGGDAETCYIALSALADTEREAAI